MDTRRKLWILDAPGIASSGTIPSVDYKLVFELPPVGENMLRHHFGNVATSGSTGGGQVQSCRRNMIFIQT